MKPSFLAALVLFTSHAFAQGVAPVSLSNQIYTVVVSSGSGQFATSGVASKVFLANGQAVVLDASGDIMLDQRAGYTYTKTGPNTGSIVQVSADGATSTQALLTFTSSVTGTYVASFLNGGTGTQTATFTLSPSTPPPLVNLSTRTRVAEGGQAIVGFVVSGGSSSRVLIRAIGPGLAAFGVGRALANPSVQVFRSGAVTPLASNSGWGVPSANAPTLRATFSAVGAFALADGSNDAATIATLEPGAYTAVVTGSTPTDSGEVLIEVYLSQ